MITKIQATDFRQAKKNTTPPPVTHDITKFSNVNNDFAPYNSELLKNYFISFTGTKQPNISQSSEDYLQFNNPAIGIQNKALTLAKKYNHNEANHYHFISSAFTDTLDFIDKLDKDEADLYISENEDAPAYFANIFSNEIYENKTFREQFKELLKAEIEEVNNILETMPPKNAKSKQKIDVSDYFYNDMEIVRESLDRDETIVNGFDIYNGAFCSSIPEVAKFIDNFKMKVNDITMCEPNLDKRLHIKSYDKRAENVFKNLNHGANMFITYDGSKVNPNYFVPSIKKMFEQSSAKLNPENTEIIEFNQNIKMMPFIEKLKTLSKDKSKNYIVIFSQNNLTKNSQSIDENGNTVFAMPNEYLNLMGKTPKNIRFVVFDTKDRYLAYMQNSAINTVFNDFGEISIPVLNSKDVLQAFKENPNIFNDMKINITKGALENVVNTSSQLDGLFPDKTLNLLRKLSGFYIDKKEITPKDVDKYIKESGSLFKQSNNDSSIEIVFDTGKRLKDIIGKENTKKEAEYIIKQIKNKSIGTKGFIVYSQDGMTGGGRRHTAEVIAGESNVPFVSINTLDFGTKEVDLFGGSIMSPEASMKKLFSLVNTQAEANPNKSVVLFIENFEYFSVGEIVSEYHQKAMAQLIREMDNAEKKGLNIVVMGSVSSPKYIGEATMKSFRFTDNIEISSPAFNPKERAEVLKHAAKKDKLKIAGTPEEQDKLLEDMAKTLIGFPYIELKSFMKKAKSVALERNHKEITKADLIESYLRLTTGRPSTKQDEMFEKELTTRHEAGHAVTLQVMNDLFKKSGKPWHIPDMVNFITLDPRGYYGGAMYHKKDINHEKSFEATFTDIVCSYGGHSAEKHFYDMDGSMGITCDLDSATSTAEYMVKAMGQGHYTGKISLTNMYGDEDFERNITNRMRDKIDADVTVITQNALQVSDTILECYSDFIKEFSNRYAKFVGTGDCLVDGDEFRKEFAEWKARQPQEKQEEMELVDTMILDAIKCAKKGKIY